MQNEKSQIINQALQNRNNAASGYNQFVNSYNQKYGHGLEFNQAEYTGNEINVYQYGNKNDLTLALAHEFGHALSMDHIENSNSIMYYLTKEGTKSNLSPTAEDLAELRRVCPKIK